LKSQIIQVIYIPTMNTYIDLSTDPEFIFYRALELYGKVPVTTEIEQCKANLTLFLTEQFTFDSTDGVTCVVSDPGEEFDDLIMLRYGVYNTQGLTALVISGGVFTPQERLDYLIRIFPCFAGASFDVPFSTPNGTIHFIADGDIVPYKVKRFVNCGPCSIITLDSIQFDDNATVITVGANADGSLSTPSAINQKQVDGQTLIVIPNAWNNFIQNAKDYGVRVKNMDVDITRYVPFPNPLTTPSHPDLQTPELLNALFKTTAMFTISRPPVQYGLRANKGNSAVCVQFGVEFDVMDPNFQEGLQKIREYTEGALKLNLAPEYYESAAIPLMITCYNGGKYKEGVFGFSPADRDARETLACLTPESAEKIMKFIKSLKTLTPAYDPLAYIEAFV